MPELRTTFIPKTPASTTTKPVNPRGAVHIFMAGATIIFLAAIAGAAGLYFYRAVLVRDIENLSQAVTRAEEIISPSLVAELGEYDRRSKVVKTLLDGHIILSPVFDLLEALAISSVRFSEFEYTLGREGNAKMTLSGEAKSYGTLAAQSDLLGRSEHIHDPIFSNFELNPAGNVTFDFSATIARGLQLYRNTLSATTPPAQTAPVAPVPPAAPAEVPAGTESQ